MPYVFQETQILALTIGYPLYPLYVIGTLFYYSLPPIMLISLVYHMIIFSHHNLQVSLISLTSKRHWYPHKKALTETPLIDNSSYPGYDITMKFTLRIYIYTHEHHCHAILIIVVSIITNHYKPIINHQKPFLAITNYNSKFHWYPGYDILTMILLICIHIYTYIHTYPLIHLFRIYNEWSIK
jgi:hypothetical protein